MTVDVNGTDPNMVIQKIYYHCKAVQIDEPICLKCKKPSKESGWMEQVKVSGGEVQNV